MLMIDASSMQVLSSLEHCDLVLLMLLFSSRNKVYNPPRPPEAALFLFHLGSAATRFFLNSVKKMELEHFAFGGRMSSVHPSLPLHPEWKYSLASLSLLDTVLSPHNMTRTPSLAILTREKHVETYRFPQEFQERY